ncbi:MAG: hypothetical protein JW913_19705 [Chitinispirillaceae bacterium]|nr:hypothetical protein [Chitinispirillaceae bacterium]
MVWFLLAGCMPPHRSETYVAAATIPVADERLCLSPLISEAQVEHLPDWPSDPQQQKILLKTFDEIWERLQAEFRRCQKYGLYTMVDDYDNPTVRISVILTTVQFVKDTLSMPVRLQAERLRDDQRFIYTLPAIAVIQSEKKASQPFHYYGQLFSDYRRRFPYTVLVSFFCRHKIE